MREKMLPLHLVNLKNLSILEQLQHEEALLRADQQNWCLINDGSLPAIVMGISCQFDQLVDYHKLLTIPLPVIRRFSGGGTVVVDQQTIFVTFIFNSKSVPVAPFPLPIMRWTEMIYRPLFKNFPFQLKENDYVIANKKIGGNAQSIIKNRWLHHSTFLFKYNPQLMNLLLQPSKAPPYRSNRKHEEFLATLSLYWQSIDQFKIELIDELKKNFLLEVVEEKKLQEILKLPHRRATTLLDWQR